MSNSYFARSIVLYSDMNPRHEVYLIPLDVEKTDEIQQIAGDAYDEWFAADETTNPDAYYDAIGSYIEYKLKEAGYIEDVDYIMAFGPGWDEEV